MWRLRQFVDKAQDFIAPEAPAQARPPFGFRILYVDPGSQCGKAGLESLFDYIVSVDGQLLESDFNGPDLVAPMETLYSKLAYAQRLGIWSAKGGTTRVVSVTPQPTKESFGLGITLRWASTECADHVWHVLDVKQGSPAAKGGLIAHSDYIVGAHDGLLEGGGEQLLGRAVSAAAHNKQPLRLFVYNHDYSTTRPVDIYPHTDAYGNSSMGCSIGYGLLHRLPAASQHVAPGSTLFEEEAGDSPAPVPVPVTAPVPVPAPAPAVAAGFARKTRKKPAELGDYFDEQQKISRERDGKPRKAAQAVTPPPKKTDNEDAS